MPPSRRLYLLRHAKSSWDDPEQREFDRPLARRGRRAASALGRALKARGLRPDLVLCSTAARAQETWRLVAAELPAAPPLRLLRSLYLAAPSRLLERIRSADPAAETLLLVGHNPGLENLATQLAGPGSAPAALEALSAKFPTAGLAVFELDGPWDAIAPGTARLVEFVTPKALG
ncbi:phosphohistidine phosphatase [Tistlia consotensis]|uniref:Phosphohistidine phosphatase n=1 Tax=Tistlia consotensis USBA 355 TaxID=560819 RepID=A0A1Y6CA86_9PROT|nr:histidine phosphatase family protein [Tistlia consotensis]SMF54077.1 phosphohistidine phosphatase [Tistlia consotensis USBA 355]SNR86526.1 phosphohistidine phosphatase [Tistlia consotensis]